MLKNSLLRYLITGSSAFVVEYLGYWLLITFLNTHYIVASLLVYGVIFWFVFAVNRQWSFQSKGNVKRQLILYSLLFAFNLIVGNALLMFLFVDALGMSALIAPVFKMGCIVCWNYLIYRYIIYL
jgi:putative flippase GtrA